MKRIGMLTSGGDCQSLNATMRGVVKGLNVLEGTVEIYGFIDGYKGLIYGNYKRLTSKDFSGILTTGGTILGTSRQPFKLMRTPDENGLDKVEAMKDGAILDVENFKRILSVKGLFTPELEDFIEVYLRWSNG